MGGRVVQKVWQKWPPKINLFGINSPKRHLSTFSDKKPWFPKTWFAREKLRINSKFWEMTQKCNTLPEAKSSPLKNAIPKGNESSSNHWFSGALLALSFRGPGKSTGWSRRSDHEPRLWRWDRFLEPWCPAKGWSLKVTSERKKSEEIHPQNPELCCISQ